MVLRHHGLIALEIQKKIYSDKKLSLPHFLFKLRPRKLQDEIMININIIYDPRHAPITPENLIIYSHELIVICDELK
jgi:hypothetical protein